MKAQFCPECGTAFDESGYCPNPACSKGTPPTEPPKQKKPPKSTNDSKTKTTYKEKGRLIVPDCIKSDADERPIKQYDIARLQSLIKFARAEGRLQVTNKRVLFRAVGNSILGPTALQYEFSLEEIAGIEIRKEPRFNFLTTILAILFTVLAVAFLSPVFAPVYNWKFVGTVFSILLVVASLFFFYIFRERNLVRHIALSIILSALPLKLTTLDVVADSTNNIQNIALIIASIIFFINLLYFAFARNLVVNIKTKGGTPSVEIRRKDSLLSFQHNEYTGFSQVLPGPDADLAMHEIGALIREVQQTGTYNESQSKKE